MKEINFLSACNVPKVTLRNHQNLNRPITNEEIQIAIMSVWDLLALGVSIEESGVILMDLPLQVT